MGIPSYYKKLIDTVPGLKHGQHPGEIVEWLFMDFNCLIYHCLHREDTPPFPEDHNEHENWEAQFLDCIVRYCLKVIQEVQPKNGVFIAVDGVVPMAKMRQQRLRRFKSIWLRAQEDTVQAKWDTNAITPGTVFMKKLRIRLETMIQKAQKNREWILSSSDEPGEGEHKIIAEWRSAPSKYTGNFAVYGLDADLIVLTILGREVCGFNNKIWLFREEIVKGAIAYDEAGEEVFEWFSIHSLYDWLTADFSGVKSARQFILNYCFAMSVLGNDFLPSSLGLKIRDDGHGELLDIVRNLTVNNIPLIDPDTLRISISLGALDALFRLLSADEPERICKYISKKQMMARNLVGDSDMKIGDNNWPLSQIDEEVLMGGRKSLAVNWKETYTHLLSNSIEKVCKEYLYGIQWIWAYYTGGAVCFNWFYPYSLPPLWEWLIGAKVPEYPGKILVRATDIRTVEQLALVLPLESWNLIPACPEKKLPYLAPQFYPERFSFETIGKRFFWECESMIPLPSILEVKRIIQLASSSHI